jgi:hypothetical protein
MMTVICNQIELPVQGIGNGSPPIYPKALPLGLIVMGFQPEGLGFITENEGKGF